MSNNSASAVEGAARDNIAQGLKAIADLNL
jgi:hypothetical protein